MSAELNEAFDLEFQKSEMMPPRKLGAITDWFMDKVKKVLESADIAVLTKVEFLHAVGAAYDKFVLPIDLPGPDAILDPILKNLVVSLAGKMYDKFSAA